MKFGRITPWIAMLAGIVITMLLGACRDGGLIEPPNPTDSCCARIVVSITHGRSTAPVGGVEVLLRQQGQVVKRAETGPDGHAVFSNVCNGTYDMRVAKTGYDVAERGDVVVRGCDTTYVGFGLLPSGDPNDSCCDASLVIVPVTPDGAPIRQASMRLTAPNGQIRIGTLTPAGYLFPELCAGYYQLRIQAEGFRVHESAVEIGCGQELVKQIKLVRAEEPPDSCCHGKLFVAPSDGGTGALLNGATVKLWQGGRILETVVVNGRPAAFDGLCAGAYGVSIHMEGYAPQEFEFRIECNGEVERAIRMVRNVPPPDSCCRNTATITVLDAMTQRPVAGAAVVLHRPNMPGPLTMRTDANGVATFREVCAGPHVLVVEREGYARLEKEVQVVCGTGLRMSVSLRGSQPPPPDTCCNASMRFVVKGPTANSSVAVPIMGVTVTVMKHGTVVASGMTNREGVFEADGLCGMSSYAVAFSKDGYTRKVIEMNIRECRQYNETVLLAR